ncbi:MAG: tetratricopeptide repeat protein [Anaerolineae bacterium]|nr:tetratricopeptide repeat protein [Anaerolineae bacterium]
MIHEYSGDWNQAAATYEQALDLVERLGDVERRIQLESSSGILQTKRGEYDSAALHLARFLELAGSYRKEQMVYALPALADLQIRLGETAAAEESIGRAEKLALEMPARARLVEIYRLWAELRLAQGKLEEAVALAEKAVAQAGEVEDLDPLEEGTARRALGQALLATGQIEPAMVALETGLKLLEERDPYEAARTRVQMGRALLAGGEADRGAALLRQARDTLTGLGTARDATAAGISTRMG